MTDSIPSLPPQNGDDKSAKTNPAEECGENPKNDTGDGKMDLFWFIITVSWAAIEAGAAWFFWWFSGPLEEHGYILLSDCSQFLTGSFILAVIAHGVSRAWFLKKPETAQRVWWGYGLAEIILLVLLVIIFSTKPTELNPTRPAWQPPELPDGVEKAFLEIGNGIWTIDLTKLKSGQPFTVPGVESKVRLIDNRLYVEGIGWFTGNSHYETSDQFVPNVFDEKVNLVWDRNFSPNVFEEVNQDTNPVFQVIYKRPNFISINGVFAAIPATVTNNFPGLKPGQFLVIFTFGTNFSVSVADDKHAQQIVRNGLAQYSSFRLFNYPAYNHLGQFVTPEEQLENPSKPQQVTNPEPQVAVQVLAEKLQEVVNQTNQLQAQLDAANKALIAAQSATAARTISPEQREKFIKILSIDPSKMPIKVFVGDVDTETKNFAEQFCEMLSAAGYGPNATNYAHLDPYFKNGAGAIHQIDSLTNITIPPFGSNGMAQLITIPGWGLVKNSGITFNQLAGQPSVYDNGKQVSTIKKTAQTAQKDFEVYAIFSVTNNQRAPTFPSVFVTYPTTNNITEHPTYNYLSTDDPDTIILGLQGILVDVGISVGGVPNSPFLKPGEVGFFIPEKF